MVCSYHETKKIKKNKIKLSVTSLEVVCKSSNRYGKMYVNKLINKITT